MAGLTLVAASLVWEVAGIYASFAAITDRSSTEQRSQALADSVQRHEETAPYRKLILSAGGLALLLSLIGFRGPTLPVPRNS
jgi:hypothetical protein